VFKKRDAQESLLNCNNQFLNIVGRDSFYGFLSEHHHEIFNDEEFAFLYCKDNGRPATPPSMLAVGLLLQIYDNVSDQEAAERSQFDLRWQVALGVPVGSRPFAKSTLQLFRSQLVIHDKAGEIFKKSLAYAKSVGYLKSRKLKIALDTTPIFGRGAVKDTYNLLADGIVKLMRALARRESLNVAPWAGHHDLSRYLASSIKGTVEINWDDPSERKAFLVGIVADADRLLLLARNARKKCPRNSPEGQEITKAAELLSSLLAQDIERTEEGVPAIKEGVAKDRIVSVHDPEERHGRKSKSHRFDGHKAAIAVAVGSQLITAADILPGNSHDQTGALDLVDATEENTGTPVELTLGDCAYGGGATRKEFKEADRVLVAKAPFLRHAEERFSKDEFQVSSRSAFVECPNKVRTTNYRDGAQLPSGERYRDFIFPKKKCRKCPLAQHCVGHPGKDRRIFSVHPQEHLLRNARREQLTIRFKRLYRLRQAAEHRIARLSQLGMRQARYIGRTKTLFQLLLTATVANLTLIASAEACRHIFCLVTLYIDLWIRSIAHRVTQEARRWTRGIISLTKMSLTSTLLKTGGSCPGL
jgi:transposase